MTTVGSLFTGAGGLDMAVQALWPDTELAWWSEVDDYAADVFAWHHDAPNLGDVTEIDWTQVDPVDVMVGGFPCQDISYAGQGAGIEEGTRSGLWFDFLRGISVVRPGVVLLENVSAIVARGGPAVVGSLAEVGYDIGWSTLRASDVGACHQRNRWFAVAYDPDLAGGREAFQQDGGGAPEGYGAGVPHQPNRDVGGAGPDRVTTLPTPAVNDMGAGKTVEDWDAWTEKMKAKHDNGNGHGKSLAIEAKRTGGRWGEYAQAIARWETIHGPAPEPTDDKGRLSPPFVEWMMGWPIAWTSVEGASRAQRLKMCGNGVVPHQAYAAYSGLFDRIADQQEAVAA